MLQPRIAVSSTATFGRDCWPDETRLLAGPIFVGPNTCWADHASWPTKRKWALLPHWADMGVNPLAATQAHTSSLSLKKKAHSSWSRLVNTSRYQDDTVADRGSANGWGRNGRIITAERVAMAGCQKRRDGRWDAPRRPTGSPAFQPGFAFSHQPCA